MKMEIKTPSVMIMVDDNISYELTPSFYSISYLRVTLYNGAGPDSYRIGMSMWLRRKVPQPTR